MEKEVKIEYDYKKDDPDPFQTSLRKAMADKQKYSSVISEGKKKVIDVILQNRKAQN